MTLNRQLSAFKKGADDETEERTTNATNRCLKNFYIYFFICGNACINETQKEVLHTLALSGFGSKQQRHRAGAFQTSKKYKFKNIFIVCASSRKKS
jgi:hypothetical protein